MQVINMNINEVIPYENNPRHNEDAVKYVEASIREFGFQQPIVIDINNVVIVGHTRLMAAKRIGMTTVPVVVASGLSEEQVKAYRLADNKAGEISTWDSELLELELDDLNLDMEQFGFVELPDFEGVDYDEPEEADDEPEEAERGYSIVYELCFNNEEEQEQWYDFMAYCKRTYPDKETISERILEAVKGIME